jgi:hypothetical protein
MIFTPDLNESPVWWEGIPAIPHFQLLKMLLDPGLLGKQKAFCLFLADKTGDAYPDLPCLIYPDGKLPGPLASDIINLPQTFIM